MSINKEVLIKAIGWRIISIIVNSIVIFLIVPDINMSLKLIFITSIINIIFYYGYELIWIKHHHK